MSKIRIMSESLSNRIAAGEVIERPASVVKELVENAIDAGASHIMVSVDRAGSRRIAVVDDGCGMDGDDALLCIEPHGTSKLFSEDDIDRISTLGFRGEALPSISSVSRFSLLTRTADAREATRVRVEGGKVLAAEPGGGAVGTTIEVRDLFYNTPARRKFLKSAATEEQHIEEMVVALAIANCEVGFELRLDGRVAFSTPSGGSIENRLRELFGRAFTANLLPVSHCEGDLRVTGFVAAPGFTRIGRREQRVFINRRPVEAQAIYRGIRDGYATLDTESGRYPPVVLFLELPPEEVDVNVHPAKREVRFKSEFAVTRCVSTAVAAALRGENVSDESALGSDPVRRPAPFGGLPLSGRVPLSRVLENVEVKYHPQNAFQDELSGLSSDGGGESSGSESDTGVEENQRPASVVPQNPAAQTEVAAKTHADEVLLSGGESPDPAKLTDRNIGDELETPPVDRVPVAVAPAAFGGDWPEDVLGIFDATYILASGRGGLILIDQHAAHERVMFERLLDAAQRGQSASQRLLLPTVVELSRPQLSLLMRNSKVFEKLGFDIEPAGGTTVMVNSVPVSLGRNSVLEKVLTDTLDELVDNAAAKLPVEPEYVARAACHAAVKAHDELTPEAARDLLRQLRACRQGTLCPHGRPTMVTLTRRELEKRFARR